MELSLFNPRLTNTITQQTIEFFKGVFSDAESEAEGNMIAQLVADLITTTAEPELIGFSATHENTLVGCILLSRFSLPNGQSSFILSPVAISTTEQGKGIGQALINDAIAHLKAQKVELVFTYGDPNFYAKVGFLPISEDVVSAPQPLSYPHGWLAQSLTEQPLVPIIGKTQCVAALNDPSYW
ncbi:GNAT family N-acetyltransferase [Shewanella intestini]|uniref:N-acetyltransferase n=1 Tax=Shewanella intestini TaxID=2017544 RepID=A0ABS5I2H0_9GAMM|nr:MULTISPECIES: N-acetyltransferase [Shewanella]MBR9727550.1 N-acetyltransferase [Shewanella intestini]MRG35300.1 GNAT family N-acetyltransferase [Shewanella sp. XMDDZSB0408]